MFYSQNQTMFLFFIVIVTTRNPYGVINYIESFILTINKLSLAK